MRPALLLLAALLCPAPQPALAESDAPQITDRDRRAIRAAITAGEDDAARRARLGPRHARMRSYPGKSWTCAMTTSSRNIEPHPGRGVRRPA